MNKKLKLGFAMGGGVSLGIFSGVALAEVLKQAIAYGKDENGRRYSKVEVDVFSGASAGSMSLSIMLRTLAEPQKEFWPEAKAHVEQEFQGIFHTLTPEMKHDLVAAQVVQMVQEKIWVEEINLNRLLSGNIRDKASILNRDAVDEIAMEYFDFSSIFDSSTPHQFSERRILSDRVLFASTLANMTPMKYDARTQYTSSGINFPGLEDGLTSKVHKDIRIFDLHFYDILERKRLHQDDSLSLDNGFPKRWCRYHLGEKQSGKFGALGTQRSWNKIVATSIACGAFPIGFEPVVLERDEWEYPSSVWPEQLKNLGLQKYPFTYVDGGTFNNEPIREAFRLASFLDSKEENANFDRRIVFVDPIIGADEIDFRVKIHKQFKLEEPGNLSAGKTKVVKKTAFDRILAQAASVLGSVVSEARSNEGDQLYASFRKFEYRKEARKIIEQFFNDMQPEDDLFFALKNRITVFLEDAKQDELIPAGNMTLAGELHRVIVEESPKFNFLEGKEQEFVNARRPSELSNAKDWLKLLMFIKIDHLMNLSRKNEKAKLIAIAPIKLIDGKIEGAKLPGGLVGGFGGFTSEIPSKFEAELAKWCTRYMLQQEGIDLVEERYIGEMPQFTKADWDAYIPELKVGMESLASRVDRIIKDKVGATLDFAYWAFVQKDIKALLANIDAFKHDEWLFQFQIKVPERGYEVDGKSRKTDVEAIGIEGESVIYFELTYDFTDKKWKGEYVDANQRINIDKDGYFRDSNVCSIPLPKEKDIALARVYPNAVFKYTISSAPKGKVIEKPNWEVHPGVESLDERLNPAQHEEAIV